MTVRNDWRSARRVATEAERLECSDIQYTKHFAANVAVATEAEQLGCSDEVARAKPDVECIVATEAERLERSDSRLVTSLGSRRRSQRKRSGWSALTWRTRCPRSLLELLQRKRSS